MKKSKIFGVAILCLAFMAVGCGSGTEEPQPTVAVLPSEGVVTEVPVPTEAVITEQPMSTVTPVAIPDELPVDEEHFGDMAFCELLKKEFDADENGYFSDAELAEVKELKLAAKRPFVTLKGFSYFPNLEYVTLPPAERVELVGVPALKRVSNGVNHYVKQKYINTLKVTDCPELERLDFSGLAVGSEEDAGENFVIENCPKLQILNFSQGILGSMKGRITGTSSLKVEFDRRTELPKRLLMDANVSVDVPDIEYDYERKALLNAEMFPFEWTEEEDDVQAAAWQELRKSVEEIKQAFFLTVEEVIPAVYDENGARAIYVLVDNSRIEPGLYQWRYDGDYRNIIIPNPSYVLLYEKELPKAEQFTIEWSGPEQYQLYEYSPVSGVKGEYYGEFSVCRMTAEGKETLGPFGLSFRYAFNERGEIKLSRYGYTTSFDEIPTDGVWLPQRSEPIIPAKDDIPIDQEHFSGVFMRKFVKDAIDTDGNGYLSKEEREVVTDISLFEVEMGLDVVDGFEWFTNLESISMPYCREMVIRNCPNLVYTGAGEGCGADKLTIENCPKLEELYFTYAGVSNLYVKDCENLRCISDYCAWDVGLYDTVWEFVNTPNLTIATGGINEFGKLLIADANEVAVCFAGMWDMEISYKDGMFLLEDRERIEWKNLPGAWFLPSEELLSEAFVTDALKKHFGVEELWFDYSRLLMYSPGKGVDYLVDVVLGDAGQEDEEVSEVRCCIWITPDKEVVFFDSYETWKEERVPGWSEW